MGGLGLMGLVFFGQHRSIGEQPRAIGLFASVHGEVLGSDRCAHHPNGIPGDAGKALSVEFSLCGKHIGAGALENLACGERDWCNFVHDTIVRFYGAWCLLPQWGGVGGSFGGYLWPSIM